MCCTIQKTIVAKSIYACACSLIKKNTFLWSLEKNDPVFWKYAQNKANIGQDTSLDFADISD